MIILPLVARETFVGSSGHSQLFEICPPDSSKKKILLFFSFFLSSFLIVFFDQFIFTLPQG